MSADVPVEPHDPAAVRRLLDEVETLTTALRQQAASISRLATLLGERRVWTVEAGGPNGTLVAGPFGSREDAELGWETVISEVMGFDPSWRIHSTVDDAARLYEVHEYLVEYPLGWSDE